MAPITNSQRYQDSVHFWRDVYGIKSELHCHIISQIYIISLSLCKVYVFDLTSVSSMMPLAKQCAFMEPSVETISGENVLTWPTVVSPN
jgi:protein arginine N-methyltransferase 6